MTSRFADHFPNDCPPADAANPSGERFFRLVSSNPPNADDFRSLTELGRPSPKEPCKSCGLSIHREPGDAAAQFLTIARRYGLSGTRVGRFVAQIELCARDGVVQPTESRVSPSHHTWWPYEDADRRGTFRKVVEDAGNALEH